MRSHLPLIAALALGCASTGTGTVGGDAPQSARAELRTRGGERAGLATLQETPAGVMVTLAIFNLPAGVHGVHIHAVGRCEGDFASAGGHFNPTSRAHGRDNPNGAHVGDLQNVDVPPGGTVRVDLLASGASLRDTTSLLDADGAALVVHENADDYRTDPSGNSGPRIACGVITR